MTTDEFYIQCVQDAPLVKDTSIRTYLYNMKKAVKASSATNIHDLLMNPTKYIPILKNKMESLNSRISIWIAIILFMRVSELKHDKKDLYNTFYTVMMDDRKERNKYEGANEPTQRQKDAKVPWDQVISVRDSIPKTHSDHLLIGMYTYIPPRRQSDYWQLRVYTKREEDPLLDHNHMHLNHHKHGPYMFIKDFKTAKVMKPFFNKFLPKELVDIIAQSIKDRPREYLFVQANDKPFNTVNAYTKYSNNVLKRHYGKKEVTVNALRHSMATFINNKPNITVTERRKFAYLMGHTMSKNMIYAHITK